MICRSFKRNGIKLLDRVKFNGIICSVAGFDLEDNHVLIIYKFGWNKKFTYRSNEAKNDNIILHPSFLDKDNTYYWVEAKNLKIAYDYNNIIEV